MLIFWEVDFFHVFALVVQEAPFYLPANITDYENETLLQIVHNTIVHKNIFQQNTFVLR